MPRDRRDDPPPDPLGPYVQTIGHREKARHPGAADLALIVEVAASSLVHDRGEKLRDYAAAGVPPYWLPNLDDPALEVYSDPKRGAGASTYDHRQVYGPDDEVPYILDGAEIGRIAVRDILP